MQYCIQVYLFTRPSCNNDTQRGNALRKDIRFRSPRLASSDQHCPIQQTINQLHLTSPHSNLQPTASHSLSTYHSYNGQHGTTHNQRKRDVYDLPSPRTSPDKLPRTIRRLISRRSITIRDGNREPPPRNPPRAPSRHQLRNQHPSHHDI